MKKTIVSSSTPVSASITFIFSGNSDVFINQIKAHIETIPNKEDLRGIYIIDAEYIADLNHYSNFEGVDQALKILKKDPQAKIVLTSIMSLKGVQKRKPEIDVVLKYENVRFTDVIKMGLELPTIFQKRPEYTAVYTLSNVVEQELRSIFHTMGKVEDWNNPEKNNKKWFNEGLKKVREYFPSLQNATTDEIKAFLADVSSKREEVMKGQELDGVYCDVEGTLIVEGQINQAVLAKLKSFENEGKVITVWTDGDLALISEQLKGLGISYEPKSKAAYAGATVKIAIDDKDEYAFTALTKISVKKFIQVTNI